MTDLRQDSMTGEQWVLEERSADPPSTEEGERWLRTDLNSGDKIATLRVDVGSSIQDVPIFSTGTAVDTVSEAMRIQVNNTTGYVPIAPVSDAAFPELRMQHNSQVHGFHDRVEPESAISDIGNLHAHYDASDITASDGDPINTWPDASPNGFDATGGSPIYRDNELNGEPVVDFDGVDDVFHTGYEWDTTNSRAFYVVHRADTETGNVYDFGVNASENTSFSIQTNNAEFVGAYGDTFSSGGDADANVWYIQEHHAASGNAEGIANGSQVDSFTYTAGGLTGDEDAIGARNEGSTSGDQFADVSIAEILVYQAQHGASTRQSVRDYLNNKYAVF